MNLAESLDRTILPRVEKPSRYLGTEINSVHKDPAQVRVRLALVFPDLYDIGLGNLGLHILYAILNRLDGVWAERVYAPAPDMEALLRGRGLGLFALESKDTIDTFDGIGFTLQTELTYTNILNLIDLAGLPLRTEDRRETDPLVFAGGPSVFNPEPLAPFMDFFVIGDGEAVVVDIARILAEIPGRRDRLEALATLEGVYVPALYPMETLPDGRVVPPLDAPRIRRCITRRLEAEHFPVDYIVPFTRQVHDRISLEVLRGCTQGCRFCQAGMTTRPVRERTVDEVDALMQRALQATGYEEVSLVSLSTCDHSRVRQLVDRAVRRAAPDRVSVSLPSLRLDSFSVELADMVAGIRRTGLTFAPEAASPRLRAVINKWIPDEELLEMSYQAFERGWDHVKLYFMIGLPTERDDDVEAIADLTLRTLACGRRVNRKAKVNTGVSTFVPKPFTPFQWAPQIDMAETNRRQAILEERFRRVRGVKFGRHSPEETFIEGIISRGDRRVADVIETAWRLGARFDAWDEHRRLDLWLQALEACGQSAAYWLRERGLEERLPWDHIDVLIPKRWFREEWQRALELKHAEDCRHRKCVKCGVIDRERPLCAHMLRNAIAGRKEEQNWVRPPLPPELSLERPRPGRPPVRPPEPPAVQRLVFRVGVVGTARFLSHLEMVNAWIRTLRRARAPLSWSEGFHPHPKLAFSGAKPVGEESLGEYLDITLQARVDPVDLMERLRGAAPEGFRVVGVREIPLEAPALMARVVGAEYALLIDASRAQVEAAVARVLRAESLLVERKVKRRCRRGPRRTRQVDVRPMIRALAIDGALLGGRAEGLAVRARLVVDEAGRSIRPRELIELLGFDPAGVRVVKLDTYFAGEKPRVAGVALPAAPLT